MPLPLLALPIAAAALGSGAAVSKGVGQARAAKKMFTPAEQAELDEMNRRKIAGELGLTSEQQMAMEQQYRAAQGAVSRERQAQGFQQQAAAAMGGPVSGRDIFLREQGSAGADMGSRQQQNVAVGQAEAQQAAMDQARIDMLRAQKKQSEAAQAQAKGDAVAGVFQAGASAAASGASFQQSLALQEASLGKLTDEELLQQYNQGQSTAANPYSKYV